MSAELGGAHFLSSFSCMLVVSRANHPFQIFSACFSAFPDGDSKVCVCVCVCAGGGGKCAPSRHRRCRTSVSNLCINCRQPLLGSAAMRASFKNVFPKKWPPGEFKNQSHKITATRAWVVLLEALFAQGATIRPRFRTLIDVLRCLIGLIWIDTSLTAGTLNENQHDRRSRVCQTDSVWRS